MTPLPRSRSACAASPRLNTKHCAKRVQAALTHTHTHQSYYSWLFMSSTMCFFSGVQTQDPSATSSFHSILHSSPLPPRVHLLSPLRLILPASPSSRSSILLIFFLLLFWFLIIHRSAPPPRGKEKLPLSQAKTINQSLHSLSLSLRSYPPPIPPLCTLLSPSVALFNSRVHHSCFLHSYLRPCVILALRRSL